MVKKKKQLIPYLFIK